MEDTRKEKREKSFFALPDFTNVKKQRENYLVSLRKKKRTEMFMAKRNLKCNQEEIQDDYDKGLLDYYNLEEQFQKDLLKLGLTAADYGPDAFEKMCIVFEESTDTDVLEPAIRIMRNLAEGLHAEGPYEMLNHMIDKLVHKYTYILEQSGSLQSKYETLWLLVNITASEHLAYSERFYTKAEECKFIDTLLSIIDWAENSNKEAELKIVNTALWLAKHL